MVQNQNYKKGRCSLFTDSNIHPTGKKNSRRALGALLCSVVLHTEGFDPAMIKVSYKF